MGAYIIKYANQERIFYEHTTLNPKAGAFAKEVRSLAFQTPAADTFIIYRSRQ